VDGDLIGFPLITQFIIRAKRASPNYVERPSRNLPEKPEAGFCKRGSFRALPFSEIFYLHHNKLLILPKEVSTIVKVS
jgi:hypothetical protein